MNKRNFTLLSTLSLALVLMVSIVAGACGPSTPETVEWRFQIEEAEGTPEWVYIKHCADEIYARTDGEVKITIYPEEALGYEHSQLIDLMGQGLLEGTILRCAKAAGQVPVLNLGDLPFLQDSAEQAEAVAQAVAPIYDKGLEPFNVHVAAVWKSAPTGVTCKVNVNTLEAWKGVTLRAWSPTLVDLSNLLGVKPVQMPYSEAFSGLATGIIDGVFWTPSAAVSEHTYDAGCMYYDQWNIFTMTNAAVFGGPALDGVSSKAQDVVMEVFEEFEPEVWRDEYWSFENDYAELRTHGVTIVAVDPAEIAKVRSQTSVVWDNWLAIAGEVGLNALNDTLNALGRSNYR